MSIMKPCRCDDSPPEATYLDPRHLRLQIHFYHQLRHKNWWLFNIENHMSRIIFICEAFGIFQAFSAMVLMHFESKSSKHGMILGSLSHVIPVGWRHSHSSWREETFRAREARPRFCGWDGSMTLLEGENADSLVKVWNYLEKSKNNLRKPSILMFGPRMVADVARMVMTLARNLLNIPMEAATCYSIR